VETVYLLMSIYSATDFYLHTGSIRIV